MPWGGLVPACLSHVAPFRYACCGRYWVVMPSSPVLYPKRGRKGFGSTVKRLGPALSAGVVALVVLLLTVLTALGFWFRADVRADRAVAQSGEVIQDALSQAITAAEGRLAAAAALFSLMTLRTRRLAPFSQIRPRTMLDARVSRPSPVESMKVNSDASMMMWSGTTTRPVRRGTPSVATGFQLPHGEVRARPQRVRHFGGLKSVTSIERNGFGIVFGYPE